MIDAHRFISLLQSRGLDFFTGVPDSHLKNFCAALERLRPPGKHLVAANEGNAVGLAIGHYLATGRPAAVYMQNSGLGNAVNPLTSLADREIYGVKMLLIIGWRGEPGRQDEPQHLKQGRITPGMLELLEVPYRILEAESPVERVTEELWAAMEAGGGPAALLVRGGTFAAAPAGPAGPAEDGRPGREEALAELLTLLRPSDLVTATTGRTGRELFELRLKRGEIPRDFLTVGGMGHGSSIALGLALARPDRTVVCLDGDGALLMHLGAMSLIGSERPANFVHVLLNNQCHDSVGGQPTCALGLDFLLMARACGYPGRWRADSLAELAPAWEKIVASPGPHFLEISLRPGARPDLGRPTSSPRENLEQFRALAAEK